ncbi:NADPH-dependent 2,4-dienoyl-CoA reductase, sulfur reductase [Amycolatopsis tolypomycina]|uniref:NADPH-dependent 2,4-dienoyl-CoA reductase, sulfur reductase n=1 Tax=Amycolatopsis tolypomycina TaxID=208445 RepID=A0A1H5CAM2_9PSEU|nr:FAD-dependent oxidoreductase [Amycolatopsis tolypomycina]SED63832.1 NADPH-dependent 2,4-dienoyl-CoA reductase, sulfur reductase [Amycolatopsis tolypomycina]
MTRVLVIGGSDAGISAGLRVHELAPDVRPLLVVADGYPNFSICGIPYHVSGEVSDWRSLAHRTRADLENAGLDLRLNTRAVAVDPDARTVTVTSDRGQEQLVYDQLVIGTGAVPIRPPIEGLNQLGPADGVHLLHTMDDTFALTATLDRSPRSAVVVGGGYIGLEMVEALRTRDIDVTLVERLPQVLSTVDPELGALVADELRAHDVDIRTGTLVHRIERTTAGLKVSGSNGFEKRADVVLVVVGVRPDTALAETAGVKLGVRGAIAVDRGMRTNVDGIFAAGDCVHTYHRLLGQDVYLPLGTTAHKQGRVAGENALGGSREFTGSLGTQVLKVFDLAIARTGLRDHEAVGFRPVTVETVADDHKAYYPGARPIHLRITGDADSGRLLGAQLVGHRDSAVHKRVDTYAAAIHHAMAVADIEDLDLSYTPPLGSPFDAVQTAAQAWVRQAG